MKVEISYILKQQEIVLCNGHSVCDACTLYSLLTTALTDATVWVLDRRVFQAIMMKTGLQRREESTKFLRRLESEFLHLVIFYPLE